ncbi:MAG TPA: SHOCT domain-containing protein [Candidatus Limnocylindrales bacterium]|jgi:uncharacterized membrane protein
MNRKVVWRLIGLVVVIAAVAAVGAVAYNYGINAGHNGTTQPLFGPLRGTGRMVGFGFGYGLLGLFPVVVFGLLLVGLFAVLFARPAHPAPSSQQNVPGTGVDGLRELSEMRGRGELTDEEFTIAKKRLLGL